MRARRAHLFVVACVVAAVAGAGISSGAPASQHRLPDPNTWVPGGGAASATAPAGPSPVVYPPQRLPLVFSHGKHLARGMACTDCHANALTSVESKDLLLPGEATCARCHAIDRAQPTKAEAGKPPTACVACHVGWKPDAPIDHVSLPAPSLVFSHAAHATASCATCHGDLSTVDLATRDTLPMMATCLSCHDGKTAAKTCTTCHPADPAGRVRTALPDGSLVPRSALLGDAHDPGWSRRHAAAARAPDATCTSCHAESECADCHAGTSKPFEYHPGDYQQTHAIEARRGVPDCTVCHRQASFCVGCHERSGVGARAETDFSSGGDDTRYHPAGWGQRAHAAAAKRNLDTCASCHRDDFCLTCHSAERDAPRVSPHPAGWRGSAKCKAMDKRNRRLCLRCHVTAEEVGCDF
jgi:hypothetical protein